MVVFGRTPVIFAPSADNKVFLYLPPNAYLYFREDGQGVDSKLTCPVYVAHDLSGSSFRVFQPRAEIVSCTVGLGSTIGGTCDPWVGPVRGWVGSSGLDQSAICVVARQTPEAMEDRQGPIGIFVHPHRDLHVMKPMGVLRDL